MPEYLFRCDSCDKQDSFFRPVQEASEPAFCSRCNAAMRRDYRAERGYSFVQRTFSDGGNIDGVVHNNLTKAKERDILKKMADSGDPKIEVDIKDPALHPRTNPSWGSWRRFKGVNGKNYDSTQRQRTAGRRIQEAFDRTRGR